MKLEYTGFLKDGKLHIRNRKQLDIELPQFFKEGNDIEITFERKFSKRSEQQNKLWWLYMTILGNELGYRKDEIHEICKFKFLKAERVDERTGEVYEYLKSTTQLTKSEFAEIVDRLISWAADMKIELPLPNTQLAINV